MPVSNGLRLPAAGDSPAVASFAGVAGAAAGGALGGETGPPGAYVDMPGIGRDGIGVTRLVGGRTGGC